MSAPLSVAVLASGSGTNLQALLDRFQQDPESPVRVTRLLASRPDCEAVARAERCGVTASVLPADAELADWLETELETSGAGLVVLAGWLKLIPGSVVRAYRGRMLNIHPALLPSFGGPGMYGRRVHEAVVRSGSRISGVTVHFVDEVYDHGPIIAQWPVPVFDGDDAERLAGRVLKVEHQLLPAVVEAYADRDFTLGEDGRVLWTRPWFSAREFEMSSIRHGKE